MVSDIRYVGGFGRMSWVDLAGYRQAQPDPLASSGEQIIGHMNADHAGALVELCHAFAGRKDVVAASMTAVDRYGFELIANLGPERREALRIGFRSPQDDAESVRRELIAMLADARA